MLSWWVMDFQSKHKPLSKTPATQLEFSLSDPLDALDLLRFLLTVKRTVQSRGSQPVEFVTIQVVTISYRCKYARLYRKSYATQCRWSSLMRTSRIQLSTEFYEWWRAYQSRGRGDNREVSPAVLPKYLQQAVKEVQHLQDLWVPLSACCWV